MTTHNRYQTTADVLRWIARVASILLAVFILGYVLFATLMIVAAREELFPKMLFSFLALYALVAAMALAWWRETLGVIASLAALAAYRMAEQARLGYSRPPGLVTIGVVGIAVLFLASSALRRRAPKAAEVPDAPAEP